MECPNCGNEVYELLDYAIARRTNCYSIWDPYIYILAFRYPMLKSERWDTSELVNDDLMDWEDDQENDLDESGDEEEEDREIEEFDDWDEEDGNKQESDY